MECVCGELSQQVGSYREGRGGVEERAHEWKGKK